MKSEPVRTTLLLAFERASAQLAAGQNNVVDVVERSVLSHGGTLQNEEPEALDQLRRPLGSEFIAREIVEAARQDEIVGDSGDTLLPLGKAPLIGTEIDGKKVRKAFALASAGGICLRIAVCKVALMLCPASLP